MEDIDKVEPRRVVAIGAEFQRRFGPSRSKQFEYIRTGKLPVVRFGKRNFAMVEDAEALLRSLTVRRVA